MTEEARKETTPLDAFIEHQKKAADETVKAIQSLVPPEFKTHSREASKEFILAFKVLLEGAAEVVDREINKMRSQPSQDKGEGSSTTGKSKVKVEVS